MPATTYLRASEADPAGRAIDRVRPRGPAGVGFLPRVILPRDPPERPMGVGHVTAALVAALLCALIVAGLVWFAVGLL